MEALSASLGASNQAGLPDGGFFGPGGLLSPAALMGQNLTEQKPPPPRLEQTPPVAEQNAGKVDALLSQLSELLASRVSSENETAQLKRQLSDQQAQIASLTAELARRNRGSGDPASDEKEKADQSPTPPGRQKEKPSKRKDRKSRDSSEERGRSSRRRSGKSAKEKRRRQKERASKSRRRGRTPRRERRAAESDRERSRGRQTRRAGLPFPGRDIPYPSIRVAGITHAVAGGDIPGANRVHLQD